MQNQEIGKESLQPTNDEIPQKKESKTDDTCVSRPEGEVNNIDNDNENNDDAQNVDGKGEGDQEKADQEISVEQLRKELFQAVQKRDEYLELAQRIQAEFENFKKRNKNAIAQAYESATADTIKAFLPVLDNLERALDSVKETEGSDTLIKGIEMVVKQFKEILKKFGVEEIEAVGRPFDPRFHNAIMQVEADEEKKKDTVVEVFQKGYKLKERVIRYSLVKVAK